MARPQQEACSRNILSILILANLNLFVIFFFFWNRIDGEVIRSYVFVDMHGCIACSL